MNVLVTYSLRASKRPSLLVKAALRISETSNALMRAISGLTGKRRNATLAQCKNPPQLSVSAGQALTINSWSSFSLNDALLPESQKKDVRYRSQDFQTKAIMHSYTALILSSLAIAVFGSPIESHSRDMGQGGLQPICPQLATQDHGCIRCGWLLKALCVRH